MSDKEIFLLTKPPHSERAQLCRLLLNASENAVLYLAGDGVYNLMEAESLRFLPPESILVSRDDLEARGVQVGIVATVPEDFYRRLVEDMAASSRIFVF